MKTTTVHLMTKIYHLKMTQLIILKTLLINFYQVKNQI